MPGGLRFLSLSWIKISKIGGDTWCIKFFVIKLDESE